MSLKPPSIDLAMLGPDGLRYQGRNFLWLRTAKDFPLIPRDTARMPSRWSYSCCI